MRAASQRESKKRRRRCATREETVTNLQSDWFATVTTDGSRTAAEAFAKVEQLLARLQAASLDSTRSTASFTKESAQVDLHHDSGLDMLTVSASYSADHGGMSHPLGFEEYYRLRDEPPIEQDVLEDLGTVIASGFDVEETYRKGRRIRRVVTQVEPGERSSGSSVSGWLLPPRWFLPQSQLITRRNRYSYTGSAADQPRRGR